MSVTFPNGYVAPISGPATLTSDEGYAIKDPGKREIIGTFVAPATGLGLGALIGRAASSSTPTTLTTSLPRIARPDARLHERRFEQLDHSQQPFERHCHRCHGRLGCGRRHWFCVALTFAEFLSGRGFSRRDGPRTAAHSATESGYGRRAAGRTASGGGAANRATPAADCTVIRCESIS